MSAKTKIAAVAAAASVAAATSTVATRGWVEKFVAAQIETYDAEAASGGDGGGSDDGGGATGWIASRTNDCLMVKKTNLAALPNGTCFCGSGGNGSPVYVNAALPDVRVDYGGSLDKTTLTFVSSGVVYTNDAANQVFVCGDGDGYFTMEEVKVSDDKMREVLGK